MKYIQSFFAIAALFISSLTAQIVPISEAHEMLPYLDGLESSDLVVFDIDSVLVRPTDAILEDANLQHYQRLLKEFLASHDVKKPYHHLENIMETSFAVKAVDPLMIQIVKELQQKGVQVICLTAREPHYPPKQINFETRTIESLQQLGYDFSSSNELSPMQFSHFSHHGYKPTYREGVILTGQYPKGDVLKAFLKTTNISPKRIIFVDDRNYNVYSVEDALSSLDLEEHYEFHYVKCAQDYLPLNESIARHQIQYLLCHEEWLSDEDVKALLQENK